MRRCTCVVSAAALAATALFTSLAGANTPVLTLPSPPVVYTAGSSAVVDYTVTADDSGAPVAPSCLPASGSTFPRGTTTVTCTADDGLGSPLASGTFTVTVVGPPTLSLPAGIVVTDQAPTVTFDATATDELGVFAANCNPVSPHLFPIGTTTVSCSAARAQPGAATATGSFTVTVQDTTPPPAPTVSGPTGTITDTTPTFSFSSSGATSFVCAFDSTSPTTTCTSPTTASSLPAGTHSFSVAARNGFGNTSAAATATFTIDGSGPTLSPVGPLNKSVEADGPGGTKVTFAVTGDDEGVAVLPSAITCAPASATVFPLGTTTVACQAADGVGNIGSLTFSVTVTDTKAPTINAPNASFTATDANGIASSNPAISGYLNSISATDLVSTPRLNFHPPAVFPIGKTTLLVTARDSARNTASKNVIVTVLPPGTPAPAPDLTPPARVTNLKAKAGDHSVVLTWERSPSDVARVEVRRSIVGEAATDRLVYSGLGRSVSSSGLRNGVTYRFVVVAFDKAGNSSASVVVNASPRALLLSRPLPGARISNPPRLRWASVPATYFNVQLFRGGTKILSAWPARARLQLAARWTYKGRTLRLKPGVYTWYVWPGIGPRAKARYGELLGRSSFVVAPKDV